MSFLVQLLSKVSTVLNKPRNYLLVTNILLVFFLILLFNLGVLPFKNWGDFSFFTLITFIFALYRPSWAFLFFIGTITLENIDLAPKNLGLTIRPYQFIGALTILAVLTRLVLKRLDFNLPKINWTDKAVVIFTAAGFISILGAMDKNLSLKYSVIILSFATFYFLVRLFIQNLDDIKKILPFFLSSSAVVMLYGLWQNIRFMQGLKNFETMPGRPNATFVEADWLGIFLVLTLAVIYSLIFYFHKTENNDQPKTSHFLSSIFYKTRSFKLFNSNQLFFTNLLLYSFLAINYILLILTVSRSAWLGAITVSIVYYGLCLIDGEKRIFRKIFLKTVTVLTLSVIIVHIFNLTTFKLGNRVQSAGTGLQKITISCTGKKYTLSLPKIIRNTSELEKFHCRHINLEDIEKEKAIGNTVKTIYRYDPNINVRSEIYHKSWEKIKEHPILGIGWGNISRVLGTDNQGTKLNSSNIFLEVWLGTGIIGLVSFIFILFSILIKSIKNIFYVASIKKSATDNLKFRLQNLDLTKSWNFFLILSFLAIFIPNLFNAGIMLGFMWVWLAIASAKTKIISSPF